MSGALSLSFLYLIALKLFRYVLNCEDVELSFVRSNCELACRIVTAGSISKEDPLFALLKLQNFYLCLFIIETESYLC